VCDVLVLVSHVMTKLPRAVGHLIEESLRERVKQRIAEPLLFERLSVISSP
jgi:hypothetical protein